MYYIEYFRRRPGVPIETFHETVRASFDYWQAHNPPDRLVLLLGRTWRLGPSPEYLAAWEIEGVERLTAWEEAARAKKLSGAPNVADVAEMVESGLYEELGAEAL